MPWTDTLPNTLNIAQTTDLGPASVTGFEPLSTCAMGQHSSVGFPIPTISLQPDTGGGGSGNGNSGWDSGGGGGGGGGENSGNSHNNYAYGYMLGFIGAIAAGAGGVRGGASLYEVVMPLTAQKADELGAKRHTLQIKIHREQAAATAQQKQDRLDHIDSVKLVNIYQTLQHEQDLDHSLSTQMPSDWPPNLFEMGGMVIGESAYVLMAVALVYSLKKRFNRKQNT